jgi:hypothetical protein
MHIAAAIASAAAFIQPSAPRTAAPVNAASFFCPAFPAY